MTTFVDFTGAKSDSIATMEYFHEGSARGSTNCDHVRSSTTTSVVRRKSDGLSATYINNPSGLSINSSGAGPLWTAVDQQVGGYLRSFNWKKLASSSSLGLIQAIAEMRDTVKTFKLKWWKELTYGGIEFGLKPLVADMQGLMQSFDSLVNKYSEAFYEDSVSVPITNLKYSWGQKDQDVIIDGSAVVHKTGRSRVLEDYRVYLDRLGFHPDLSTLWDLKPLSFLVDYFLPVGDLIEALIGKGWVDSIRFDGWISVKYKLTVTWMAYSPTYYDGVIGTYQIDRYHRNWWSDVELINVHDPVELETPTFRQIFNTLYVLFLGKREKRINDRYFRSGKRKPIKRSRLKGSAK